MTLILFVSSVARGALGLFAVAVLLACGPALHAQSTGPWEGTWETEFGTLEIDQRDRFVFGDFRSGDIFEGVVSADNAILRGRLTTKKAQIMYVSLRFDPASFNRFTGRWAWGKDAVPSLRATSGQGAFEGARRSSSRPSITHFPYTPSLKAHWDRTPSARQSWAFFGRDWRMTPPQRAQGQPNPNSGRSSGRVSQNRRSRYSHIPVMADFPANYRPRFIEIGLSSIQPGPRFNRIYGTAGVYAFCDAPGSTRPLRMVGNRPHRVLDRTRRYAESSISLRSAGAVRRFELHEECLGNSNARLRLELRSNLSATRLRKDVQFGTKSINIFLDELPRMGEDTEYDPNSSANGVKANKPGEWAYSAALPEARYGFGLSVVLPGTDFPALFKGTIRFVE